MNSSILSSSEMKPLEGWTGEHSNTRSSEDLTQEVCSRQNSHKIADTIQPKLQYIRLGPEGRSGYSGSPPSVATSIECRTNLIPKYILKSLHQPTAKANATSTLVTSIAFRQVG